MYVGEENYENKENNPQFTGFHRIKKLLFFDNKITLIKKYIKYLYKDILELQNSIQILNLLPHKIVESSASLIEEIGVSKISREQNRYSKTDLENFESNLHGAKNIIHIFETYIMNNNSKLSKKIENNFKILDNILNLYKKNNYFENYDIFKNTKNDILFKSKITFLTSDVSLLCGILGLN